VIRASLKTRVIASFLALIVILGGSATVYSYYGIRKNVVDRAQRQVRRDLSTARSVYLNDLGRMRLGFQMAGSLADPSVLKARLHLDYLVTVNVADSASVRSSVVRAALAGADTGATRIIDSVELRALGDSLYERAGIDIVPTPHARPSAATRLTSAMAMECATPLRDRTGRITGVVYGGRLLNRHFDIVDKIHDMVYENRTYHAKPVGTVTIFQNDVRIATNVLTQSGVRAIGTRVSEAVFANVVERGQPWNDRAFVVTDWYLTAYEPIRDINGSIIGILYVGILEKPFRDMMWSSLAIFLAIMLGCSLVAVVLAFVLAGAILDPVTRLARATTHLANGDLTHRVPNGVGIREIHDLAESFNEMTRRLSERETSLQSANRDLDVLNKRYIDLVGMVSHELKGILSSTMLNAYTVRDGYLGPLTDEQKKALDSVTRNLEYFDLSVKNFLNLSRIEKGELAISPILLKVRDDIVNQSIDAFSRQAQEKRMSIVNRVPAELTLSADGFLLSLVLNNMLGNAVKYGVEGGAIEVSACRDPAGGSVTVEVYNDGRPIVEAEMGRLFRRFSRLDTAEGRRVRGTGLGLFLCREIVERHSGRTWCEPRAHGNAFLFTIPHSPSA